jgi:hypothetical protein
MDRKELEKRVIVSITGREKKEWQDKINEINYRKIKTAAVFLSAFPKEEKEGIYEALLSSCIKKVPLVHLRDDSTKQEIRFFINNFGTRGFTIHERDFAHLNRWDGFHKSLVLEMNYDNKVPKNVNLTRIGGFCIDLSHFKAACERGTKDLDFILKYKNIKKYFLFNHLNGYDYKKRKDVHVIKSLDQFNYLETLPKFIFGKVIAIETWNTIQEQLRFKKKIIPILSKKL